MWRWRSRIGRVNRHRSLRKRMLRRMVRITSSLDRKRRIPGRKAKPAMKSANVLIPPSLTSEYQEDLGAVLRQVLDEVYRARSVWPAFHSSHEAYGVFREEADEFWQAIKDDNIVHAHREAIQTAAMAVRFVLEVTQEMTKKESRTCKIDGI